MTIDPNPLMRFGAHIDAALERRTRVADLVRESHARLADARQAAERARLRAIEVRALAERIAAETANDAP